MSVTSGLDEALDAVDDLVEVEVRRVDHLRVGGGLHLRRVALVPQRRSVASASAPSPGRSSTRRRASLGRVGDEVDLHLRVGHDDGADVTPLDDGVSRRWRARAGARA